MKKEQLSVLCILVLAALACGPVIAISWNEFLIIGIFIAALLGPPLYRFVRRVEQALKRKKTEK